MAGKTRKWGNWEATEDAFARGGQGIVYRVKDVGNQHLGTFVLKELLNPKRSERFKKEIEAITRLKAHPNVIKVVDYGAFKDPDKPTYVMPEADCNLDAYVMSRANSLTVNESLEIFDQIAAGIEHLHQHQIIHRDVKPDNVLMFDSRPTVSDFGLCLIADTPRVTPAEEAVGPRFYMAPELEDGRHIDVTLRADIYSLGKVLYFLLSGGKVFSREKFQDKKWNLAKLFDDDRYELFNQLFRRTIAPEHDRYMNCGELRSDLLRLRSLYNNNPKTTLQIKIPNVAVQLDSTREILHELTGQEWVVLLDLRKRKNAIYSEAIATIAADAISQTTAKSFGKELLRVGSSIEREYLRFLAARVIACSEGDHLGFSHQEREELSLLALESNDRAALREIATNSFQQSPRILSEVAQHAQDLDEKGLDAFVMASSQHAYPSRGTVLLNLSREKVSRTQLGFIVAGLMDEGSELALDRIVELLRERSSIEEIPEIFQGMVLRGSTEKLQKIVSKGGYSDFMQRTLDILLDISSQVDHKSDDESEHEFDD
ncbi:serine/threonine-protein kinase [Burkholderia cepacia]|uniref:serine/threonine-protein kinase n=1 Tax=Burkholderia cepacia TaxID=292 RepID=UPI0009C1A0DD|nr:serine/threonine-protein kinase [Burkholderia cepacia]